MGAPGYVWYDREAALGRAETLLARRKRRIDAEYSQLLNAVIEAGRKRFCFKTFRTVTDPITTQEAVAKITRAGWDDWRHALYVDMHAKGGRAAGILEQIRTAARCEHANGDMEGLLLSLECVQILALADLPEGQDGL